MDRKTWNNLTKTEQDEIKQMGSDFIKMVRNSSSSDGYDFFMKHEVGSKGEYYFIFEKSTGEKFGNFTSKSQKVIEGLLTDAAQNYGR